jgi:hypothetical protein
MSAGHVARLFGAALAAAGAVLSSAPPAPADDQPCPDVEVVFARGTGESSGPGEVGQAFVDSLRSQAGSQSINVYPVNYEASSDFSAGIDFAKTVVDGIRDAATHIESTVADCPQTRVVAGGFSQGAAVAGFVTSDSVPPEIPAPFVAFVPQPMPPEVANHVAAVTLFGPPSAEFLTGQGAPPIRIGPLYEPKTIELCASGDTICDGTPAGPPTAAHALYPVNGMTAQAATFAARRL